MVVILTKPRDTVRNSGKDKVLSAPVAIEYPEAARAWVNRSEVYNRSVREVMELEKEGRALIVAPYDISGLKTLSQDHEALEYLYRQGLEEGEKVVEFFREAGRLD